MTHNDSSMPAGEINRNSSGQPLCAHGVAPSLLGGKLACKACWDDEVAALRAKVDTLTELAQSYDALADGWSHKCAVAEAEVERMRPVVGNALEWRDNWPARTAMQWDNGCEADLCAAVDAYRATSERDTAPRTYPVECVTRATARDAGRMERHEASEQETTDA